MKGTTDLLDLPPGLFLPMTDVMKMEAIKVYPNQVETAAKCHAAVEEEKQSLRDKDKKVLEEAASLEPKEVLNRAFESFIKGSKYYGKNKKIDYVDMLQAGVKHPALQVTESKQKREIPWGRPGAQSDPSQKGKRQRQEQEQAQQGQGHRQRKGQAWQRQREEQGQGQRHRKKHGEEQEQGQRQRKRQGQPIQGEEQRQRQVRSGARSLERIRGWRAVSRAVRKRGRPDLSAAVLRLLCLSFMRMSMPLTSLMAFLLLMFRHLASCRGPWLSSLGAAVSATSLITKLRCAGKLTCRLLASSRIG